MVVSEKAKCMNTDIGKWVDKVLWKFISECFNFLRELEARSQMRIIEERDREMKRKKV
jgi:hypothetical protein